MVERSTGDSKQAAQRKSSDKSGAIKQEEAENVSDSDWSMFLVEHQIRSCMGFAQWERCSR